MANPPSCQRCQTAFPIPLAFAFQPIVEIPSGRIWAYESLVRGPGGESAASVLSQVTPDTLYAFDQSCRAGSLRSSVRLGLDTRLHINFLPNAVYEPERCLETTLRVAREVNFPPSQIVFEVVESEAIRDTNKLRDIIQTYRAHGFLTALDDFGAGSSGLNTLADFQPDMLKLDIHLIRDIHQDRVKQAIVRSVMVLAESLDIMVLAEGIETVDEARYLWHAGIHLMQGYFFAKPGFDTLPLVPREILARVTAD